MKILTTFTLLTICLIVIGAGVNYECEAQSHEIVESLNKFDSSRTVFYLPANKRLQEVPWRDSVYRFPSFEPGIVTFATGYSPPEQLRMNYNLYFMQMDYISSEGDTLQIKPLKELKLVSISGRLFYHDDKVGYIEVIQQLPVALGVRNMMIAKYIDYLPGGTYRKTGYTPFGDEDVRGAATTLDRYYLKGGDYFFIDRNNEVYKATSVSLFRLFREHKKSIKIYIDEHDVDFEKKEHLMNLLVFCNELD
jgi:hypothetical protein